MDVRVEDGSNRLVTPSRAQKTPPCTLVIFGAGGDLTKRLLMPAIYNLAKDKLLSEKFSIIAVDRTPKPIEAYRDYLAEGIRSFVSDTAAGPATEQLGAAGLVQEKDNGFRRVIIEKPFGSDLASARALNDQILRVLPESQIY